MCINGTGSAYAWLKNRLAPNKNYFELEAMAQKVAIGANGLSFFPFGNGAERMLGNKILGAQFSGLQFSHHEVSHMTRACLEGIAFSSVYGLNAMQKLGIVAKTIKVGNDNMFQSSVFATTIATLTGAKIQMIDSSGAYGAAYGATNITEFKEAFKHQKVIKEYVADTENIEAYQKAYQHWKKIVEQKL